MRTNAIFHGLRVEFIIKFQPIFVRQTTEKLREKSKDFVRALSEKKVIKKQTSTSAEKKEKPKKGIFAKVFYFH